MARVKRLPTAKRPGLRQLTVLYVQATDPPSAGVYRGAIAGDAFPGHDFAEVVVGDGQAQVATGNLSTLDELPEAIGALLERHFAGIPAPAVRTGPRLVGLDGRPL